MRPIFLLAPLLLAGCVSTQMKSFVGKDISEAFIRYGAPEQVIQMPDGRRAFQFRWGGGVVPVAGQATTAFDYNTITTTATPAMIYNAPGCLITFIATGEGSRWTVTETRTPKQLVC